MLLTYTFLETGFIFTPTGKSPTGMDLIMKSFVPFIMDSEFDLII